MVRVGLGPVLRGRPGGLGLARACRLYSLVTFFIPRWVRHGMLAQAKAQGEQDRGVASQSSDYA